MLADRIDRGVCTALTDPPTHLTSAIGMPRPDNQDANRWEKAATVIETYRLERGITDERRAFGPRPSDIIDRWTWQQIQWDVEAIVAPPGQLDRASHLGTLIQDADLVDQVVGELEALALRRAGRCDGSEELFGLVNDDLFADPARDEAGDKACKRLHARLRARLMSSWALANSRSTAT